MKPSSHRVDGVYQTVAECFDQLLQRTYLQQLGDRRKTTVELQLLTPGRQPPAARAHLEQAEKLLYLVADPATAYWLTTINPTAEDLYVFYREDLPRRATYRDMAEHILGFVRQGLNTCAAFYGHPGVLPGRPAAAAIWLKLSPMPPTTARADG